MKISPERRLYILLIVDYFVHRRARAKCFAILIMESSGYHYFDKDNTTVHRRRGKE